MGDIADMMLDGTLCEGCGGWLDEDGEGFPRRCAACRKEPITTDLKPRQHNRPSNTEKVACPECGRHVKAVGLADHQRDRHGMGKTAGR